MQISEQSRISHSGAYKITLYGHYLATQMGIHNLQVEMDALEVVTLVKLVKYSHSPNGDLQPSSRNGCIGGG
jgi:hypothetical protein